MQNMSSIENCNLKTIMLLDKLCKKKNKTKQRALILIIFVSKQWICQWEGLIQPVSIKWLGPYSDEFTLLIASKNALQRIKSNNRFDN